MKITCEYCGTLYDDTLDKCPNCQAANAYKRENLGNSSPCTVADLEKWYKDRNLPPYETTRFFIGIDYKKPRAFGIFKDGENFIVYKNKDNGQRVIRYKGTDEAFAVNELYLRLKEEIINQKNANAAGVNGNQRPQKVDNKAGKFLNKLFPLTIILLVVSIVLVLLQTIGIEINKSKIVFAFLTLLTVASLVLTGAMIGIDYVLLWVSAVKDLAANHKIKDIISKVFLIAALSFLALIGTAGVGIGSFETIRNVGSFINAPRKGYYLANSLLTDGETLWYYYNDQWYVYANGEWAKDSKPFLESDVPVSYSKFSTVPKDKYLGTDCVDRIVGMGYSDFFDSTVYKDLNYSFIRGYYKYDDKIYYYLKDSAYGWYSYDSESDDWVNEYYGDIPSELRHSSLARDFYYTPTWDSQTQMTDFEDTDDYKEQIAFEAQQEAESKASNSSNSSNDSSYDWSSSDSWDSGSTDWSSDW